MLTSVQEAAIRISAALAGALGYLVKDSASDETILQTVEWALASKPIPNPLAGLTIDPIEAATIFQRKERVQQAWATLSPQQQRVGRLAAQGLTNKQIARELVVEPSPINTHMQDVLGRLGLLGRKALQEHAIYTAALERDVAPQR
jgi:DNA-binding NarL/FixJ family response regulator